MSVEQGRFDSEGIASESEEVVLPKGEVIALNIHPDVTAQYMKLRRHSYNLYGHRKITHAQHTTIHNLTLEISPQQAHDMAEEYARQNRENDAQNETDSLQISSSVATNDTQE